jgi:hypothetical protein
MFLIQIDDEIEKYMELFTELRENPADINAIVARRRKDFTGDFFRHLNFLVNAYNGLDERDGNYLPSIDSYSRITLYYLIHTKLINH